MKYINHVAILAILLLAGCAEAPVDDAESKADSKVTKITITTGDGNFTGPSNIIDWSTQNWLLGDEPPTWNYQFDAPVRILSAFANVTYDFPNPVIGGGVRTELTTWHGVDEGDGARMSSHRFFNHDDQYTGGQVIANFDMEIPAGGLIVREGASYAFAIGHYYVDAIGPNAPAATGIVDLVYEEIAPAANWMGFTNQEVSLEGGLCLAPLDINAQITTEIAVESLEGLRIAISGNNEISGDVDFMVYVDGERIMHGASPGALEMVELGPQGLAGLQVGDKLEFMIFNCQPQLSTIDWSIQWAQA